MINMNPFQMLLATGLADRVQQFQRMEEEHALRSTTVERVGQQISLPPEMTLDHAIKALTRKRDEEEKVVDVVEELDAFPADGAHALTLVLQEHFGFSGTDVVQMDSIFGTWEEPPMFIDLEIERGKKVQIAWGGFSIPGVEGTVEVDMYVKDKKKAMFLIRAKVKGKHRQIIADLAQRVRDKLKTNSVYRGKAIKMSFHDKDGKPVVYGLQNLPEFMDLSTQEVPIFTRATESQVELSITGPIVHAEKLRKNKIPLKRSVLLEGDFGTGKTLTAVQTAKTCVENGWTFLYLPNCEDLELALQFAERYSPCVLFTEDVDRVMAGERDEQMDALSYALDGVDNKNREVIIVLTTNNVSAIQKLMLRPGRIDSVVSIQRPDEDTVWRLMLQYSKGTLAGNSSDFHQAIQPMIGQNAAFIREVVNKAELRALCRADEIRITPDDVDTAVGLMQNHIALMAADTKQEDRHAPLGDILVKLQSRNGSHILESA